MKHRVLVEIEIPDDYPDLCWTAKGSGPQVVWDLMVTPAMSGMLTRRGNARSQIDDSAVQKDYISHLEKKMEFLQSVRLLDASDGAEFKPESGWPWPEN